MIRSVRFSFLVPITIAFRKFYYNYLRYFIDQTYRVSPPTAANYWLFLSMTADNRLSPQRDYEHFANIREDALAQARMFAHKYTYFIYIYTYLVHWPFPPRATKVG